MIKFQKVAMHIFGAAISNELKICELHSRSFAPRCFRVGRTKLKNVGTFQLNIPFKNTTN